MGDKKLSAYDVLSQMSGEDLIVALKSLGEGKYQNANVKLSKMAEEVNKLNGEVFANQNRINVEASQRITNVENTKANVDLSNISEAARTTLAQNSRQAEAEIINNLQWQIDILKRQMHLTRERLQSTRLKVFGSYLKNEPYEV